jgi:FkbM family methyltransferase
MTRLRLPRLRRNRAPVGELGFELVGPTLLDTFARLYPEAIFVEVGSNDGDYGDHLRPHVLGGGWRGVMVEPLPHIFERLVRNYGDVDGVELENAAISSRDGSVRAYHLAPLDEDARGEMPAWYDAVGSLSRDVVLRQAASIPGVEDRIREVEVRALTFAGLCRKHGLDRIDLLAVDTEGHDFEVLKGVDLERLRPRLVVYEHLHLGEQDRVACRARLEAAGYEVMEEAFDTWCLDTAPADDLSAHWRRLEPRVPGVSSDEWEEYRRLLEAPERTGTKP